MENENSALIELDNPNNEQVDDDIDIDELSNQVQSAFDAWDEKIQRFKNHIEMFKTDVERAVSSQGKGYLILNQAEAWLDKVYESATSVQDEVQSILQEAQRALKAVYSN